jgi:RND family efflux transporter MFP subunit
MILRPAAKIAAQILLVLALCFGAPILGVVLARMHGGGSASSGDAPRTADRSEVPAKASAPNDFVGVLLPPKMANLSPRADGRIVSARVKIGQAVRSGDILVSFDPREREHDLAIAEAQLRIARAEAAGAGAALAAARKRASRRTASVEVGGQRVALVSGEEAAQSQFEAESAGAKAVSAGAKIAELKAKVQQLKLALEETDLRAPFDGMVTALNFEPGATAHTGDAVIRIVGGVGLRARIAVPEEAADLLRRKQARLTLENRTFYATIDQVAPEVEPASRTFVIEGAVRFEGTAGGDEWANFAGRAVRASLIQSLN